MTEITIQQLAQKIYDLPAGKTLHFKRYSDRDLFGVTRLDIFNCDTILISYYGGLNTSVFDATVDYAPKDIASWVYDVIEINESDPVYFLGENEVLPVKHELWGITFRVVPCEGNPYRIFAMSKCLLFDSQEKAEEWIANYPDGPFETAFPNEICDTPKAVLIDKWCETSEYTANVTE